MSCGTPQGYRRHLALHEPTCPQCRAAWSRDTKRRHLEVGRFYVPSGRSISHLRELQNTGMTLRMIAERANVSVDTLNNLNRRCRPRVHATTEKAVLAVSPRRVPTRIGTLRRIQALLAIGWTHADMQDRSGHCTAALMHDDRFSTSPRVALGVGAMYERLAMTRGPSAITARRAAAKGYLPPLAWDNDNIDVLDAKPGETDQVVDEIAVERAMRGDTVTLTKAEQDEVIARLTQLRYSARVIGQRIGRSGRTVQRKRAA